MSPVFVNGVEQGGIPSGLIVMWHGLIANIPSGWVICDGNNGTPNLLAKFVEGVATAATNPGATGGEATHVLTVAELPAHSHNVSTRYGSSFFNADRLTESSDGTISTRSTTSTGSGSAHENRPPFYDIAYLMKT